MCLLLHCNCALSQLPSCSTANEHISSMTKLDQLQPRPLRWHSSPWPPPAPWTTRWCLMRA